MTASISYCRIQLNKSLLFEIVFIAGWIPRLNYTFEKIKRINAKYYSSSHLCVGVRECVVRESACMACKRSAVRSRYSPPKKHCTSCEVQCFSFFRAKVGGCTASPARFSGFLQAVHIRPPALDAASFPKNLVCCPNFQQAAASLPSIYGVRSKLKEMLI